MNHSSVVRVFATTQESDYGSPWQAISSENGSGSGVVIGPNQILTGAHVVADATFLQVQKISATDKIVARVQAICHDSDLALLELDDAAFMDDVVPATLGDLPEFQERVSVVGFPVGGEELSITEGVVSRVEVQRYSHSKRSLLAVTIDAAINDGNSGGPVFNAQGLVVGIAFQSLKDAENSGEMVPAPLIRHFLEGAAKGLPLSVPGLGIGTQSLENPVLRKASGLKGGQTGILVRQVWFGGSSFGVLQKGDVILSICGQEVANNGTLYFRKRFRTSYHALLCEFHVGSSLEMRILRKGEEREVRLCLRKLQPLVPANQHDHLPTYFVYAGLVFQPLSLDYLETWNKWWERAPSELVNAYYQRSRTESSQSIVVLTQVLSDEINVGYGAYADRCVVKLNGIPLRDMEDFVDRVEGTQGYVELELSSGVLVILESDQAQASAERILRRYRIAQDRSADLRG